MSKRTIAAILRETANVKDYRSKIINFAISKCRDLDIADDLVQMALADALCNENEWEGDDIVPALLLHVRGRWWQMVRRKGPSNRLGRYSCGLDDAEEIKGLSTSPNQDAALEVSEIRRLIATLPARTAHAVRLAGLGHDNIEIAATLGCGLRAVAAELLFAREFLGRVVGRPNQAQPLRFRGVRKHGDRWVAEVQSRRQGRKYLGTFETAEEAAVAFDVCALATYGDRATLNFPLIKQAINPNTDEGRAA